MQGNILSDEDSVIVLSDEKAFANLAKRGTVMYHIVNTGGQLRPKCEDFLSLCGLLG